MHGNYVWNNTSGKCPPRLYWDTCVLLTKFSITVCHNWDTCVLLTKFSITVCHNFKDTASYLLLQGPAWMVVGLLHKLLYSSFDYHSITALVSLLPQSVAQQVALHNFYQTSQERKIWICRHFYYCALTRLPIFGEFVDLGIFSLFFLSQKFMSTNTRPSKPWRRRLDVLSLKYRHSYAKPWLKISLKEHKCPCKAEEDICLMCCSIHYSHISTLWLNQNFGIFSKKHVLFKM